MQGPGLEGHGVGGDFVGVVVRREGKHGQYHGWLPPLQQVHPAVECLTCSTII
jgi:hypothetical protein